MKRKLKSRNETAFNVKPNEQAVLNLAPAPVASKPTLTAKLLELIPFKPLWFSRGGRRQTVFPQYFSHGLKAQEEALIKIKLNNGEGELVLVRNGLVAEPKRIIFLLHGLTGSSRSNYMERFAYRFWSQGYLVFRMNMRNSGEGFLKAQGVYHSGRTEDLKLALEYICKKYKDIPISMISFSLGANVALKLASEMSSPENHDLKAWDSHLAVCAPFSLSLCASRMNEKKNLLFQKLFMKDLLKTVGDLDVAWKTDHKSKLNPLMSIEEFDQAFTAPLSGFSSAKDYYAKAECGPHLKKIQMPTVLLSAEDDPIVDAKALELFELSSSIDALTLPHGGHLGFLSRPDSKYGVRWLDHFAQKWFESVL